MATETSNVNGNYGATSQTSSQSANMTNGTADQSVAGSTGKDEVGWYFVEQYYTTMSRSPEKVHLFYNKRSQFVYGVETEKVHVSVGQKAISERIAELGIEECKVRVTNVDSQESGKSIVLQVVGEMSVKSQPHRKFVQTFVLAEQPNGYFVLNDIFRFIADDPEEEEELEPVGELAADAPTTTEENIKTLTSSDNPVEQSRDAEIVDKKLEEAAPADKPSIEAASVQDSAVSEADTIEEPVTEDKTAELGAPKVAEPEVLTPEKPKDPTPTPSATPAPAAVAPPPPPPKEAAAPAPAPAKPSVPKTWASMLAGNKVSPAVPIVSNVPTQAQPKATAAPASSATSSAPAVATAPQAAQVTPQPATSETEVPASPGGWQSVGQESNKKQNRNQPTGVVNGYIKNVTATIDAAALKQHLSQYGKLVYFDVSRPKNCAFIEFENTAGYNAAVAANPHKINGEEIVVEERRPRANTYGNNFRGGARGGRGGAIDGRTPSQGGRGGPAGRGNFAARGRGGPANRGRGGAQDA